MTFVTGHEEAGKYRPAVNWQAIAHGSETIVIYMGIHNLPYITGQLQQAGLSAKTPIALVRWGTRPEQEELIGTLETIAAQVEAKGIWCARDRCDRQRGKPTRNAYLTADQNSELRIKLSNLSSSHYH